MGRDVINIKGTKQGLIIVCDPGRDFEEIKKALLHKMESARGFFKGARFSFLQLQNAAVPDQTKELENICVSFGMVPNGEFNLAGLPSGKPVSRKQAGARVRQEDGESSLLVYKSLRSGQRVSYRGHVIIIGDVHPGAEVFADGNVLVMGACRGMVHAGVSGDRSARVIAARLAPMAVNIAGERHAPDEPEKIPPDYRLASLSVQGVVFSPYQTGR